MDLDVFSSFTLIDCAGVNRFTITNLNNFSFLSRRDLAGRRVVAVGIVAVSQGKIEKQFLFYFTSISVTTTTLGLD